MVPIKIGLFDWVGFDLFPASFLKGEKLPNGGACACPTHKPFPKPCDGRVVHDDDYREAVTTIRTSVRMVSFISPGSQVHIKHCNEKDNWRA